MRTAIRSILPFAAVAVLMMAILDLWIRVKPLDMVRTTQILLSIALLVGIAVLLSLVLRVEREDGGA